MLKLYNYDISEYIGYVDTHSYWHYELMLNIIFLFSNDVLKVKYAIEKAQGASLWLMYPVIIIYSFLRLIAKYCYRQAVGQANDIKTNDCLSH